MQPRETGSSAAVPERYEFGRRSVLSPTKSQEGTASGFKTYVEGKADDIVRLLGDDPDSDIALINNSPEMPGLIRAVRHDHVSIEILLDQGVQALLGKGIVQTRRDAVEVMGKLFGVMNEVGKGIPRATTGR